MKQLYSSLCCNDFDTSTLLRRQVALESINIFHISLRVRLNLPPPKLFFVLSLPCCWTFLNCRVHKNLKDRSSFIFRKLLMES